MAEDEGRPVTSVLPKACENCRQRKTRCDRRIPCSNCQAAGIVCRPPSRLPDRRPRLLVSDHYEKQLELIQQRLSGIEELLKESHDRERGTSNRTHYGVDHGNKISPRDQALERSKEPNIQPSYNYQPQIDTPSSSSQAAGSTPVHFEGDSSFNYQTIRASQVAQLTANKSMASNPEMSAALSSMKNIVLGDSYSPPLHGFRFSKNPARAMPEMELLPISFVVALLKRIKVTPPIAFLAYSIRDHDFLEKLCQKAYFPTNPVSLGELTYMHGMLNFITYEYLDLHDPFCEEYDMRAYCDLAGKNFELGIETYEIMAEPTFSNASALLLGAFKSHYEGNIFLCWTLISAAARHVQALGYHRKITMQNDGFQIAETKRHLFWSIYLFEKNISLCLGRSSNIQDYDIDVELFKISENPQIVAWDRGTLAFVALARMEGQIYERLYSVSALNQPTSLRARIAEELAQEMDEWYKDFSMIDSTGVFHSEAFELYLRPTDVIYYALLTSVHRSLSMTDTGTEISSRCFEAARMSLECHLRRFPAFIGGGTPMIRDYVSWVLLYVSFTPYIVVFIHAIASGSLDDVKILKDTLKSLEHVRSVSKECERLYQICHVFCRVAQAFVDSQHSFLGTYNEQADSLLLPEFSTQQPEAFQPNALADFFSQDGMGDIPSSDINGMSVVFGNWFGGTQPAMDFWSNTNNNGMDSRDFN